MAKTKQIKIGEREFTIRKLTLRQIRDWEEAARSVGPTAREAHDASISLIRTAIKSAGTEPPAADEFLDFDPEDIALTMTEVMAFSHLVERGEARSP